MMQYVRGSELETFLRCRLKWKFAYIEKLVPRKPNNKMFPGTLMHKFLEVFYRTGDEHYAAEEMQQLFNDTDTSMMDETELDELWETVQKVSENYIKLYGDTNANIKTIATELMFAIDLDNEIGYTGTMDWIFLKDGDLYLADHKLTASIDRYDKNSDMDRQISRYLWALQKLASGEGFVQQDGEWIPVRDSNVWGKLKQPSGFVYNLLLRDYPVPPRILKNGSLSKDKSQNTTFELYIQEMLNLGIAKKVDGGWQFDESYVETVDHLKNNPKQYFRRLEVHRNQAEIDASIEEMYATALDMQSPRIYRTITHECPWCPFQPICVASMDGSNVDFLTETLFIKGESHE